MADFDPRGVKALLFDTFGTIVDWRGSIIAEGESYWRPEKGLDIDWPAFADVWRAGYRPAMDRVESGDLPWTKIDDLHRMVLDTILPQFGLDGLSEDDRRHLNFVWHRLNAWPDAPSGLLRLKSRYVISPLSNGNLALLTDLAKFAGLPWDCILASDIFRRYKPDPQIYLEAAAILGLEPGQVMMCAAHVNDLNAAKVLGLRTGFIHRPHERGPGVVISRPDEGAYDVVAADIRDLASQLGL